jgi:regulator of cell morphogenesis and NO signaling
VSTTESTPLPLERTLGELVAERPARARVLERFGLDYCCHGHRTLADAVAAAQLDPTAVTEELLAVVDLTGAEVDALDPAALVDHILETHHAYLHEELPLLIALSSKVRDVHGSRHPELERVTELVAEIRDDLDPHLAKEERVLFPAIHAWLRGERSFPFGSISNPVRTMMLEHDRAGELLEELRAVTQDYAAPSDGCTSYRLLYERLAHLEADTHRHVHLENNVLFPTVAIEEP